jgi:hypothetical protein
MASTYLREQVGGHCLRSGTFTKPPEVWVRLWAVMPDNAGGGGTEVSRTATGYSPIQHGPGDTYWETNGNGSYSNLGTVQFGEPVDDWGDVVGVTLHTDDVTGNMLDRYTFASSITVESGGQTIAFAQGDLTFSFT